MSHKSSFQSPARVSYLILGLGNSGYPPLFPELSRQNDIGTLPPPFPKLPSSNGEGVWLTETIL